MTDKTVVDVPSDKLRKLFAAVIDAQFTERADWEAIATESGIACVVNGVKGENATAKTRTVAQFVIVYADKHCPKGSKDSAEYKDAIKNGRAHFSTCINRTLIRMGHRPERSKVGKGAQAPAGNGSTNVGQSNGAVQPTEFAATVLSMLNEAQRLASVAVQGVTAFVAETKLSKVQAERAKALVGQAQQVADAVNAVQAAILAGKVAEDAPTALENALRASVQAQGNGASTVQ